MGKAVNVSDINKMSLNSLQVCTVLPFLSCFCQNEWGTLTRIISHEFWKESVVAITMATKALVPKLSAASEGAIPELDQGCFDLPAFPTDSCVCTLGTGRALEPHSSCCYCLPRWTRTPSTPTSPCPQYYPALLLLSLLLSHSLSPFLTQSLRLSPLLLSVFVPQGPVVQLKLSVTQRNPNWLSSAACYQLCTFCICASLQGRKNIDFAHDSVIIIGFESLLSLQ